MGLGKSTLQYEGYGITKERALESLDSLVRFHYDHATVRRQRRHTESDYEYYIWDGDQGHVIYFEKCRGRYRAFIIR